MTNVKCREETKARIRAALHEGAHLSSRRLSRKLGIDWSWISILCKELMHEGDLVRRKEGKGGNATWIYSRAPLEGEEPPEVYEPAPVGAPYPHLFVSGPTYDTYSTDLYSHARLALCTRR